MDEVQYDEEGNPIVRKKRNESSTFFNKPLTAIFQLEGGSYDVKLTDTKLSWTPVGGGKTFKRKKSKKSKDEDDDDDSRTSILVKNIIGLNVMRQRHSGMKEGEGIFQGFSVFTYDRKESCRFKSRMYGFRHPSEDLCTEWLRRIRQLLDGFSGRPKKLKIFLQPFAGKKQSRSMYNKICHLFDAAAIHCDIEDINHNEQIKQSMVHIDLKQYDSVVCVGGDGTVSKVVNALLTRTQKDESIEIGPRFSPRRPSIPVGIIPTGTFNQIAYTMFGTDDLATAAIHIILGHKRSTNVCSVFKEDRLLQWSFCAHYGFFGSVLVFLNRYSKLGEKKVEASFMKALTKSKFRSYECEIQYLPLSEEESTVSNPNDGRVCRKGCGVCDTDLCAGHQSGVFSDTVQYFDPLNESGGSSIIADMTSENPYKTIKGDFLSMSLLSLPGNQELAPLGVGKYTHINNGYMDLVLVHNQDKKEFLRYLKRHGNHKNQFEFPFVETHRTKEVRMHMRFHSTWKHKDHSYSEIEYEMMRKEKAHEENQKGKVDEVEVIDDLIESCSDDDEEDSDALTLRTGSADAGSSRVQSKDLNSNKKSSKKNRKEMWAASNEGFKKSLDDENQLSKETDELTETNKTTLELAWTPNSTASGQGTPKKSVWDGAAIAEGTDTVMNVSEKYRPTFLEVEKAKRGRERKKKDMKKKMKDESKMKGLWNLDNETCTELDLNFRVHQGLIILHGQGIPEDFEPDEVKMGCLSIM